MLDFPAIPTLASFCASAQNRFPPPPDWLIDDPVTISSDSQIEDFVSFLHTGITLATRSAFDGNTILSTTGQCTVMRRPRQIVDFLDTNCDPWARM